MFTNYDLKVVQYTEEAYDLIPGTLTSFKSRFPIFVEARSIAMYLMNKHPSYSSVMIGRIFSKDHTTVLHNCKKIEKIVQEGSNLFICNLLLKITEQLKDESK